VSHSLHITFTVFHTTPLYIDSNHLRLAIFTILSRQRKTKKNEVEHQDDSLCRGSHSHQRPSEFVLNLNYLLHQIVTLIEASKSNFFIIVTYIPNEQSCPDPWVAHTYNQGDQVSAEGKIYQCKPWPYSGYCGQAGFEPGLNPFGLATPTWMMAWTEIGPCSESTIHRHREASVSSTSHENLCDVHLLLILIHYSSLWTAHRNSSL